LQQSFLLGGLPAFVKNLTSLLKKWASRPNRRFKFDKRTQLFIGTHDEALSVAAMCRQQRRVFVGKNPRLKRSPNSNRLCSDCQR